MKNGTLFSIRIYANSWACGYLRFRQLQVKIQLFQVRAKFIESLVTEVYGKGNIKWELPVQLPGHGPRKCLSDVRGDQSTCLTATFPKALLTTETSDCHISKSILTTETMSCAF